MNQCALASASDFAAAESPLQPIGTFQIAPRQTPRRTGRKKTRW
jgi:hypothetical protein